MTESSEKTRQLKRDGALHPNPGKVRTELLRRSPFFDAHDLTQMKYEMLRSVNVDRQTAAEAAREFGLSRVAYYRAQERYQAEGLAGLLPRKRGPKQPHKFRREVIAFIDEQLGAITESPDWHLLSKQIEARFGITVHPRSVERAIKGKKKPRQ